MQLSGPSRDLLSTERGCRAHIPAGLIVLVQVAVRDHDALRVACRSRGVLEIRHLVWVLRRICGSEAVRSPDIQPAG